MIGAAAPARPSLRHSAGTGQGPSAAARSTSGRAWTEPGPADAAGRLRGGTAKEWQFLISFPQVSELRNSIYGLDQSGRLTATADGYVGRHR